MQHAGEQVEQIGQYPEDQVLPQAERQRDARREDGEIQPDVIRRLHAVGMPDHPRDHDLRQQQPGQRQPRRKAAPCRAVQQHHDAGDQQRHQHARHGERRLQLRILTIVQPHAEQHQHDGGIGAAAAEGQAEIRQLGLVSRVKLIGAHGWAGYWRFRG